MINDDGGGGCGGVDDDGVHDRERWRILVPALCAI